MNDRDLNDYMLYLSIAFKKKVGLGTVQEIVWIWSWCETCAVEAHVFFSDQRENKIDHNLSLTQFLSHQYFT